MSQDSQRERFRYLNEALAADVEAALRQRESVPSLAQAVASSLLRVTSGLIEELAELADRVKQLEDLLAADSYEES